MRKSLESAVILALWLTFAVIAGIIVYEQSKYLSRVSFRASASIFLSRLHSLILKTNYIKYISYRLSIPKILVKSKVLINSTALRLVKEKETVIVKIKDLRILSKEYLLNSTNITIIIYRRKSGEIEVKIMESYQP